MAGVINPGQRDTGILSTVMKGLAIARDVYGIKSDMAQFDRLEAEDKKKLEQDAEANKLKDEMKQREADKRAGVKTPGEIQELELSGKYQKAKPDDQTAIRIPTRGADGTVYDSLFVRVPDKSDGLKAPTSRTRPDGVMEEWDSKTGWKVVARKPEAAKNPKDEAFEKLPKTQQTVVTNLSTDIAKKLAATSLLDEQLAQFRTAYESNDETKAALIGVNMVKLLNSDQGADAVGAEESKRLAADLEYQIANFFGKGETWGRNLPRFFETSAGKSNAMKASARANQKIIDNIYAGTFAVPADLDTKLVEGGDGNALAAPGAGFKPRRQKSPKDGKWYREIRPDEWMPDPNQKD